MTKDESTGEAKGAVIHDDCTACGGEGWVRCADWLQCSLPHVGEGPDQECQCRACSGSGWADFSNGAKRHAHDAHDVPVVAQDDTSSFCEVCDEWTVHPDQHEHADVSPSRFGRQQVGGGDDYAAMQAEAYEWWKSQQ